MNDARLKISPPWITTIHKIQALFDGDPQIACNIGESSIQPTITLAINNGDKVTALQKLLPTEKQFGNVTLKINIDGVPSNRTFITTKELFECAFAGNPAFAYCVAPVEEGYWYVDFTYVVFKNCVVQFFNDNLNDAHGVLSTLYQDIAAELFVEAKVNGNAAYCTDVERKLGMSTSQWP